MPTYICPRCDHIFDKISNYKSHLMNKQLCPPVKSDISLDGERQRVFTNKEIKYTCNDCNKGFSTKQGLDRHTLHHCKKDKYIKPLVNATEDLSNQLCNTTNNISNVKKFFCNENSDYIGIKTYLNCIEKGDDGIIQVIKLVYMNPEHPENHTYYIKSVSSKTGLVYIDNKWTPLDTHVIIQNMILYAITLIKSIIHKTHLEENIKNDYFIHYSKIGKHKLSRIRNTVLYWIVNYQVEKQHVGKSLPLPLALTPE